MNRLIYSVILILVFTTYTTRTVGQPATPAISADGDISATGEIWAGDGFTTGSTFGGTTYGNGIWGVSSITFKDGTSLSTATTSGSSGCTAITYLPYTVSSAGVYCFTGNLSTSMTSGRAIQIEADNVVIDLNGWMLDGLSAGSATSAVGIGNPGGIGPYSKKNIIIRNGTIRGFWSAIRFQGSNNQVLIEDITAINSTAVGIYVNGKGNIVRRNQVLNINSSTFAVGIDGQGASGRYIDNDIENISSTGTGTVAGIKVSAAPNSIVEGNRISNITAPSSNRDSMHSISLFGADFTVVEGNHITNTNDHNIAIEIYLSDYCLVVDNRIMGGNHGTSLYSVLNKYRDNLTAVTNTPYLNGKNEGNNQ